MKKIDTIVVAPHFYTMEGAGVGYHSCLLYTSPSPRDA